MRKVLAIATTPGSVPELVLREIEVMRHKLIDVGFGIVLTVAVILASGNREPMISQQGTPSVKNTGASANRRDSVAKASVAKTLQDLTEQINDLKSRISLIEAQQDGLRGRLTRVEQTRFSADLSDAASDLARFDCESDFNRAHAMATSQGTPGYTLEGAAAMNCTQRLAKITEKALRSIENR